MELQIQQYESADDVLLRASVDLVTCGVAFWLLAGTATIAIPPGSVVRRADLGAVSVLETTGREAASQLMRRASYHVAILARARGRCRANRSGAGRFAAAG